MKQLAENILDIAENSVRAKATEIVIRLTENLPEKLLTVSISDNGSGMSDEMVSRVTDPFCTTRMTRKVGLGIPLFKMEAEMTGGEFSIRSTLGKGTETKATFHTDHIDFVPLGDVAETLMTLIGANPDIRFVYCHEAGARSVSLDTNEMKEMLGDVPLSSPEVMLWIRDYVRLCYGELYSDN